MTRKAALTACKVAGYHGDQKTLIHLYVENRVNYKAALKAFGEGSRAKAAGIQCTCPTCKREQEHKGE